MTYTQNSVGCEIDRTINKRWASPDPYLGSMNLAAPQSFNRYSYVSGDPVNFVDPSGLRMIWTWVYTGTTCVMMANGWDCEAQHDWAWVDTGGGFPGGWNPLPIQGPPTPESGGSGSLDPLPGDSDCERFAKEVEKLVAKYPNAIRSQFAELLYDRFANSGKEVSDDGFKKEFKDGSNQARHYVGGFWAGFTFGETLGRAGANLREDKDRVVVSPSAPIGPTGISLPVPGIIPESKGQTADKALNAVSARHGSNLDKSKIKNADVANLIRTEVCE